MSRFTAFRSPLALCAAVAALAISPGAASAAIGPTVSTPYFDAHATSACDAYSALHITAKRQIAITVVSAGLYNYAGALLTSTGMQGLSGPGDPYWIGSFYAGQTRHISWQHNRPGHFITRFYVDTPLTNVVAVSVGC